MRKSRCKRGITTLLGILVLSGLSADDPHPPATGPGEPAAYKPLAVINQAWQERRVRNIVILYYPKATHVVTTMRPEMLNSLFKYAVVIREAPYRTTAFELMKVVEKTKVRPSSQKEVDVRWAVIFEDANEERIASIYLPAKGKAAFVDDSLTELDSDQLVEWLDKTLAAVFGE